MTGNDSLFWLIVAIMLGSVYITVDYLLIFKRGKYFKKLLCLTAINLNLTLFMSIRI